MPAFEKMGLFFLYCSYEVEAVGGFRYPIGDIREVKLLIVGHHIVVKEYQELWVAAAEQYPEYDFEILCPEVYGQAGPVRAEALDPQRVPVHTLKSPFGPSGRQHLHFYLGLGRALDRILPDYVYALTESNSLVTAQLARACGRRGIPYCFWTSLNKLYLFRKKYSPFNIRYYLFHWCQKYTFKTCSGANATSQDAVDVLRRQGYEGKVTCCGIHGIGRIFTKVGEERVADDSGLPTPLRIGFIGRLWNWKAVDVLIRAFARMKNRSRVTLSIRGKGEMSRELRTLAKQEGVDDEITWKPSMVPYDEMPDLMNKLDVLVLPSYSRGGTNEKFGRVLIEAMASGTVAVGCDDGGIAKAMAGGGILFRPGDSEQLADILDRLATDYGYWKERQRQGFKAVCERYSYDVVSRKQIEGLRNDLGFLKTESEYSHG